MNKTIPITIARQLFYIEEGAYSQLDNYLQAVKAHFGSYPDNSEIIADIESRIAEHFVIGKKIGSQNIINSGDVNALIASMGQPEDFEDGDTAPNPKSTPQTDTAPKKLLRNPDDTIVAGVASGLAAYFNIDPFIARLIFIFSLFVGGGGIIAYLIFWLIMPIAKTPTEKLQMKGEHITLESISETIKEKVAEIKPDHGRLYKVLRFLIITIGTTFRVAITTVAPFVGRIIGFIITITTVAALLSMASALAMILFNVHSPYIDFPISKVLRGVELYMVFIVAFLVVAIPIFFTLLLGISLLRKKNSFHPVAGFGFLGLWFAVLITGAALAPDVVSKFQNFINSDPSYQVISKNYDLQNFTGISILNGNKVVVTQGEKFAITVNGQAKELDFISMEVKDQTLNIKNTNKNSFCLLCDKFSHETIVNITMPLISNITGRDSSTITAEKIIADKFTLNLENSSQAEIIGLQASSTLVTLQNSSYAHITGTSTVEKISLANSSSVESTNFKALQAQVMATNSSDAHVSVSEKLIAQAGNSSSIIYNGNPIIESQVDDAGEIRQESPQTVTE